MVLIAIPGMIFLVAAALVEPRAETWDYTMANAIKHGGLTEINSALASRQTGNSLEKDFGAASVVLKSTAPHVLKSGILDRMFAKPLRTAFASGSLAAYGLILAKTAVPDEAKQVLLGIVTDSKLMAANGVGEAVRPVLVGLLATDSLSTAFKGLLLRNLGTLRTGPAYDSVLILYLKSGDAALKSAAYWGMGQRIRTNRAAGKTHENAKVFSDLKSIANGTPDDFAVRAMAQLGQDSARIYLAQKCASDPGKLKIALISDPRLTHPGLIAEAVKAQSLPGQGEAMKKAIRYSVKNPETVVATLLADTASKVEDGLKLLLDYPELVPDFAGTIGQLKVSQNASIKSAALALQPYLNAAGAQAE